MYGKLQKAHELQIYNLYWLRLRSMCCHQIVAEHRIYLRVYRCRSFNELQFSELQTFSSELKLFTKLPVLFTILWWSRSTSIYHRFAFLSFFVCVCGGRCLYWSFRSSIYWCWLSSFVTWMFFWLRKCKQWYRVLKLPKRRAHPVDSIYIDSWQVC